MSDRVGKNGAESAFGERRLLSHVCFWQAAAGEHLYNFIREHTKSYRI